MLTKLTADAEREIASEKQHAQSRIDKLEAARKTAHQLYRQGIIDDDTEYTLAMACSAMISQIITASDEYAESVSMAPKAQEPEDYND